MSAIKSKVITFYAFNENLASNLNVRNGQQESLVVKVEHFAYVVENRHSIKLSPENRSLNFLHQILRLGHDHLAGRYQERDGSTVLQIGIGGHSKVKAKNLL